MTPVEELQTRRDALMSGSLKWVGRMPTQKGEACILYSPGFAPFSSRALHALFQEAKARGESPGRWNDKACQSPQEAIKFLNAAIHRAESLCK